MEIAKVKMEKKEIIQQVYVKLALERVSGKNNIK